MGPLGGPKLMKNKQSNKKAGAKRAKRSPRKANSQRQLHLLRHASALVNPFLPESGHVRWPDSTGIKSVAVQYRTLIPVPAITGGFAAATVAPNPNACVAVATGVTGTSVTYGSFQSLSGWSSTDFKQYRITSYGARLRCVLPDSANGGTVLVSEGVLETVGEYDDLYNKGRIDTVRGDTFGIGRAAGSEARSFVPSTGPVPDWSYVDFVALALSVTSNTAFFLEVVFNIEGIPNAGNLAEKFSELPDDSGKDALPIAESLQTMSTMEMVAATGKVVAAGIAAYGSTQVFQMGGQLLQRFRQLREANNSWRQNPYQV